jgi:hypothetical protein
MRATATATASHIAVSVDCRTRSFKRYSQLLADICVEFGGLDRLTATEQNLAQQAAIAMLRAEQLQADALRGDPNDEARRLVSNEIERALASLRARRDLAA